MAQEQIQAKYGIRKQGNPELRAISNPRDASREMYESGYEMVGYSSFTGPSADAKLAIEQAKNLLADVILIKSEYLGTNTAAIPITTPTTSTTISHATANAYGPGGATTAYGTGMSTTYGQSTNWVPVSVEKYTNSASYWIKAPAPIFGVRIRDTTPSERKENGTNRGVVVDVVVRGSPAFKADVLPGDLLLKVGSIDFYSNTDFSGVRKYAGNTVEIHLLRDNKEIVKTVQMGNL